ncbi:hypothetical protein Tco_0685178 [Tanacetum coccineum]
METKYVTIATIAGVSEFLFILPGPADGFATLNVFRADDYAPHISLLVVAYVIFIVYHHSMFKSHVLLGLKSPPKMTDLFPNNLSGTSSISLRVRSSVSKQCVIHEGFSSSHAIT